MKQQVWLRTTTVRGGAGWRPLALLTGAVLAAHLLALRASPGVVQIRDAAPVQAFRIRSIEPKPAPAAVVAAVVAAVAAVRVPAAATVPVPVPAVPAVPVVASQKVRASYTPRQAMTATADAEVAVNPVAEPIPVAAVDRQAAPAPVTTATHISLPGSVNLRYQVTVKSGQATRHGDAELVWRHDGDRYEATLQVSAPSLPTRTQHSAGRVTADGLAPTRFSDKARSEAATHFERDKATLTFSSNRPAAVLLAGAQDRLSVLLQLAAMVAGEPLKYPSATTISVQTAGSRDADIWLFTVDGEEQLVLPGGTIDTLKLTRNPVREFDQKIELWLAPGMDYVPARLRLTQASGDWLDQQWLATDKK